MRDDNEEEEEFNNKWQQNAFDSLVIMPQTQFSISYIFPSSFSVSSVCGLASDRRKLLIEFLKLLNLIYLF